MPDPQSPQDELASIRQELRALADAHLEVSEALGKGLLSAHETNKALMRAVQSVTAVVQVLSERLSELERRQTSLPRDAE